jgi:hypothetical protein
MLRKVELIVTQIVKIEEGKETKGKKGPFAFI